MEVPDLGPLRVLDASPVRQGLDRLDAPDAGFFTSLGARWSVTPGSGYYAVAQWIGAWDGPTGRSLGVSYQWLENIHDGNPFCGF